MFPPRTLSYGIKQRDPCYPSTIFIFTAPCLIGSLRMSLFFGQVRIDLLDRLDEVKESCARRPDSTIPSAFFP